MSLEAFLRTAGNNGFITIESASPGLGYVLDPDDKKRILLVTEKGGGMILSRKQLHTITLEVAEIMEIFM